MADDSDDDLLTLDVLAVCRKGYQESHRIMNERRAAKAAAEKAKKEAEAKAKKEAAEEAAAAARTPLHDVSNTKQENEGVAKKTPRVRATAPPPSPPTPPQAVKPEPVEEEQDDDAMDIDDSKAAAAGEDVQEENPTFAYYQPKKLKIGKPHPGRTVETSVMARAVPPDIRYRLHSGMNDLIESNRLSSLQLESIVYASQQHEFTRVNGGMVGGMFVGDGPGIGKGRTIAGLIYENWLRGRRKHMWFSTSNDLYHAAIKDFSDLGSGPAAIPLKLLSSVKNERDALKNFDEGVLFVTYATSVGQSKSGAFRVDQLIEWCGGDDFNGCCVFDEGHKAKKLVPEKNDAKKRGKEKSSKTALSIAEIQDRLPMARVVYVSATGASSLENMAYMSRLGIWGFENMSLFENLSDFLERDSLRKSTGALELIAMNLKTAGKYVARTLSFADTTFKILQTETSEDFCLTYNSCTEIWYEVLEVMEQANTDLMQGLASYSDPTIDASKVCALFTNQYWGAHLRFFKHLCIAAKLPFVKKLADEALKSGKCVVIGLLSTGEAATLRWIKKQKGGFDDDEDDLFEEGDDDFVGIESTLRELIKKFVPDRGFTVRDGQQINYAARREELLEQVGALELPQFPLDDLIDSLGGADMVAEITGRKVRLEKEPDTGDYRQVKRAEAFGCAQKDVNRLETAAFMRGDKLIAIISDAGSTGISLHADKRAKNRRRRVHITIELPYSSTQLVQQLGRSHRSNQASGPEYVAVISDLPGEVRFAATASQRLAQLGAITQGDRSACIGANDLKEYDLDNKFGREALEIFARFVLGDEYIEDHYLPASVLADPGGRQRFQTLLKENLALVDLAKPLTKDANRANRRRRRAAEDDDAPAARGPRGGTSGSALQVSKFFNRLLALKVDLQHEVFGLFENIHHQVVSDAKAQGKHDSGVQDLYAERIQSCHNAELLRVEGVPIMLHEISWDRGVSWEAALERKQKWIEATTEAMNVQEDEPEPFMDDLGSGTGFYRNKHFKNIVVMALEVKESTFNGKKGRYRKPRYKIIAPNTGERGHTGAYFLKQRVITGRDLHLDYIKDNKLDAVKKDWDLHYNKSVNECIHFTRGEKPGFVIDSNGRRVERFGSKECFCNPHHILHKPNSPYCPMGRRFGKSYILSGSVIKVWPALENIVATKGSHIQLVRAAVGDKKIVGVDVRYQQRQELLEVMAQLKEEWQEAEAAYHRAAMNPPDRACTQLIKPDPANGFLAVKPEVGQQAPVVKPELSGEGEEEDRKPAALLTPAAVGGGAGPAYGPPAMVVGAPEPKLSSQAESMRRLRNGVSARRAPTSQAPPVQGGAGADGLLGILPKVPKKSKAKRQRVSAQERAIQRLYSQIGAPLGGIAMQLAQPALRAVAPPADPIALAMRGARYYNSDTDASV